MTVASSCSWLLGYNFSVRCVLLHRALRCGRADRRGHGRLSPTALDKRLRRGGTVTEHDVLEATLDGSVASGCGRKLMTVTVVLASLVPLMWTRRGSD